MNVYNQTYLNNLNNESLYLLCVFSEVDALIHYKVGHSSSFQNQE